MKMKHEVLIAISGLFWFVAGCMLLQLGFKLVLNPVEGGNYPLIQFFSPMIGKVEDTVLVFTAISILAGYLKGKRILSKAAKKGIERIKSFENPCSVLNIYSKKYYILLASMVGLGFLFRFFPNDIRGFVDITIGCALIQGSIVYFRNALEIKLSSKSYL